MRCHDIRLDGQVKKKKKEEELKDALHEVFIRGYKLDIMTNLAATVTLQFSSIYIYNRFVLLC
jgi:hypothetical protein